MGVFMLLDFMPAGCFGVIELVFISPDFKLLLR